MKAPEWIKDGANAFGLGAVIAGTMAFVIGLAVSDACAKPTEGTGEDVFKVDKIGPATIRPTLDASVISATVVRIIDGDTIKVDAHPWPGWTVRINVRVKLIDTPEKGWRGKCPAEKAKGAKASQLTAKLAPVGSRVRLWGIAKGKFGGRVLAHIETVFGDLGQHLISAGLARAYHGGKRKGWCN